MKAEEILKTVAELRSQIVKISNLMREQNYYKADLLINPALTNLQAIQSSLELAQEGEGEGEDTMKMNVIDTHQETDNFSELLQMVNRDINTATPQPEGIELPLRVVWGDKDEAWITASDNLIIATISGLVKKREVADWIVRTLNKSK